MGLQINTNVAALNAYRNLNGTQGSMQTSLERLSSGLRINRAADDAAGLAISEKLRSQVNGLNQAQANAQDGVSLIQTAEGALNEVHSILQRMRTLAVQSSSDSNTDSDRAAIQKEVTALVKEVDSTATRTQFNGMNLLDGTFKDKALQIGANQAQTMGVSVADLSTTGLNLTSRTGLVDPATQAALGGAVAVTPDVTDKPAKGDYTLGSNGQVMRNGDIVGKYDATTITLNDGGKATGTNLIEGVKFKIDAAGALSGAVDVANVATWSGQVKADTYTIAGTKVTNAAGATVGTLSADKKSIAFNEGQTATFTKALVDGNIVVGADTTSKQIDLSTRDGAVNALKMIDGAIGQISNQRADLGALQNRLDHTIKNLGVSAENLAASESRIRDTDMAKEMTNFTRSQILQQAGVSMLAQANQSSQSVLKLLG